MIRFVQLLAASLMLAVTVAGCNDAYGCPPALQFNAGHCQVQQFVAPQYVQPFVQPQAFVQQQVYAQPIVQRVVVPHVQRQVIVQQVQQHHAVQQIQVQAIRQRAVVAPRVQVQRQRIVTRTR